MGRLGSRVRLQGHGRTRRRKGTGHGGRGAETERELCGYDDSGSVPLAFETVFDKGQNADFWLIKYNQAIDKTYKELEQDYAPYTGFRAFKERNIYGCNTGKVDFYEDSPFHPDRLLKDLIKIFHPTLLEGYELKYFTKLAE